jgi:hypothetical protein
MVSTFTADRKPDFETVTVILVPTRSTRPSALRPTATGPAKASHATAEALA